MMQATNIVSFDPTALRASYRSAGQSLLDVVRQVRPTNLNDNALGVWSVRDLIGHASRGLLTVPVSLESGVGMQIELQSPFDYVGAYASAHGDPAAIVERARKSGEDLGADINAGLQTAFDDAMAALDSHPDDAPVESPAGVMRLIDYLPNRVFEMVIHTADIAAAQNVAARTDGGPMMVALTFCSALVTELDQSQDVLFALTGRGNLTDFSVFG